MATAFTEQERIIIAGKLKQAARQYAAVQGVRKTTVDQLVAAADISKGAFYKFYLSKEMLFFEVLEEMHSEIYQAAAGVLEKNAGLPAAERAAEAVLAVCRLMEKDGIMDFLERDAAYLLRKIPVEIQKEHYHSDVVHTKELLQKAGLQPAGGMELAASVVRGLLLTISHREEIGQLYPEVLELLVRGTSRQLFPEA